MIANNEGRKDKKLWTEHSDGEKIELYRASDEHDESMWIAGQIRSLQQNGARYGNCAILYRANAQSRVPEEMLMRSNIPYKVFGGQKFYERKEIKDILAYLRVIVNPADDISLSRIINVPKRSIGDTTVQALAEAAAERDLPLYGVLNEPPESLGTRAKSSVSAFFGMMTLLGAMKEAMELTEFVDLLIEKTGLEEQYRKEDTEEAADRIENIRRIANVAKLMNDAGLIVMTAFISPFRQDRQRAKEIIGDDSFFEVYVSTPLEECEKRDVKGLYQKARDGKIRAFTGISSPYEAPLDPDVTIDTSKQTIEESVDLILKAIEKKFGEA